MAERFDFRRAALLILAAPLLSGCMQTVGDLGRPDPDVAARSAYFAPHGDGPKFNETDQERELHDRVWRFMRAPHVTGWFNAKLPVLKGNLKPGELAAEQGRYYRWLSKTPYGSSRTRYNTIGDDVKADLGTLSPTFASICAVIEVDRQRAVAVAELGGEGGVAESVRARKARNRNDVATFTTALAFRYESYSYALDHLLIETPHAEAMKVDGLLSELAVYVGLAEADDFCEGGVRLGPARDEAIPSRHSRPLGSEPIVLPGDIN